MAKFQLTKKAVEDLSDIWNYTFETWSQQQADKYYQLLISSCQEIASNPKIGKSYNRIDPKLFGLKANKHIIFYRIQQTHIEITRILHGRMDPKMCMLTAD